MFYSLKSGIVSLYNIMGIIFRWKNLGGFGCPKDAQLQARMPNIFPDML